LKTSYFVSFARIISSDKSHSKAQFILTSVGENRTGYCAENIDLFTHMKTSK